MFRNRARRLHFVGIGGVGMSGIAEVLATLGYDVRGSDLSPSPATERFRHLGVKIFIGHHADHVADADVVVTSGAIGVDNPEVSEARRRGVPVIRRAEMLAELMRLKYGVAVAGMHGKTTTTSLIAAVLERGGIDPTVVVGGRLKSLTSHGRLGMGEYLVAEADESDGSFLQLWPTLAVITNVDAEHLDYWRGGLPEIVDAFVAFANKVPFYGAAIVCLDNPAVQGLLPRIHKRVVTYGQSPQADFVAHDIVAGKDTTSFSVHHVKRALGRVEVRLVGEHNVLNALASIAVADEVGIAFSVVQTALHTFAGIGRRFEVKGCHNDVLVVDDYGHHPTEVQVTLEAARVAYPRRRLVVAFQPHRFSRTRDLLEQFAAPFNASHVLRVTDIYAAGEPPEAGIDAPALVRSIRAHGHRDVAYVGDVDGAAAHLAALVRPGDLVLTLGAGDIWRAGVTLLMHLAATVV